MLEGRTSARLPLLPHLPAEDLFTGSASGAMAAYLWAEGLIDNPVFVAEQAYGMNRPGQADVQVVGPQDAIEGVNLGGSGYVLMSGKLKI